MIRISPKSFFFWPVALTLFSADCATKRVAVDSLGPVYVPHRVVGDVVRFTLAYNRGAAMSLPVGDYGRALLIAATLAALVVLAGIYRRAAREDRLLGVAIALIVGGALGNLIDRLRWGRGVVDFIDLGIGMHRFWVFNVADVGVTVGAVMFAIILLRRPARVALDGG